MIRSRLFPRVRVLVLFMGILLAFETFVIIAKGWL